MERWGARRFQLDKRVSRGPYTPVTRRPICGYGRLIYSRGGEMRVRGRTKLVLGAVLALAVCALTASAGTATGASTAVSSQIPKAGTGSPTTGEFTPWDGSAGNEFAGGGDEEGADAYGGNIIDRSLSPGGPVAASRRRPARRQVEPAVQLGFEGLNHLPAALLARREPVLRRAARSGHVRRQRLRRRGRQRRLQRLQQRPGIAAAGQHGHEHRRRLPAQREPRGRPELVLRLSAGDQPDDRRPRRSS